MPANLDMDQTLEIIESSDLEDVLILNENYEFILNELPENEDKTRLVILRSTAQARIEKLKCKK